MTKYREYFDLMLLKNSDLFKQFTSIHQAYMLDPAKNQNKFNELGYQIQDIITEYENRLCHHSEKGVYAKYSHNLSDKFWELVRDKYPKIDDIGIEVSYKIAPKLASPAGGPSPHRFIPPPSRPSVLDTDENQVVKDVLDDTLNRMKKIKLT